MISLTVQIYVMAANKEAIAIVLDVGPSMNQAAPQEATSLQAAIGTITRILQRKIFSESKDEIALVLFGTTETKNPLANGKCYENITIERPMGIVDLELLQMVENDIQATSQSADFIDALIVALDHLEQGIQGKRGFVSKRLILLSDLAGPFGDDQLDIIIKAICNSNTEINIIGPDLDEEDAHGDRKTGQQKEKTPQQRAGEAMAKYILEQVNGEGYSFREALPALSYFQSRQVRPTAWKCQLEIGPDLKIPINGYIKMKEFKLKQSWKKVYARDPDKKVETSRTYHLGDDAETEMDGDDVVEGYCYGSDRIPMSAEDKESMKYKAEKCFRVLGFTKLENVKQHHYMGDSILSITGEKGDGAAAVALSSIINALYETNYVAIARRVYDARSSPRIGCLIPHIKASYQCLHWIELPFAEDLPTFTFGSLPVKEGIGSKKYAPSEEQLAAVDELITSMDLTSAVIEDNGEKREAFKPKLTFNPYFQRVYQCLYQRALHPEEDLPELSPLIAACLQQPQEVVCAAPVERLCKLFKLETVAKKKDEQTGESIFRKDAGDGHAIRPKTDDDLSGGLETITKARVTEVGTSTPVEDFRDLCSRKDKDLFDEAFQQMEQRVQQIVTDSFGQQLYRKAIDCLTVLRQECIKKLEPRRYNRFIREFKNTLTCRGRQDFWDKLLEEKLSLISKLESEYSDVSKEEADTFTAGQVLREEVTARQEDETTDDLLMDI